MAPPVKGLQHFTLVSNDVARSKAFWVDVLGATAVDREFPPCVRFAGTDIDIFAATEDQKPSPGPFNQHHAFGIALEDYDRWLEQFRAHNVPMYCATHGMRRISVYVQDPDGYNVELTVGFSTDEEGEREITKRGLKFHVNPADPRNR